MRTHTALVTLALSSAAEDITLTTTRAESGLTRNADRGQCYYKTATTSFKFPIASTNDPIGDEDCLNLNVYSPKLDSKKRAVMVYFHGGAFIMGGGASFFFGPNYLLEQNVVLVTFNYR